VYIELNERRALVAEQGRGEDAVSEEMQAMIDALALEQELKD
jgi:hypothetical protein